MEHLVIGAAQSAHNVEYARSWEQASGRPPRLWSWSELCAHPPALSPSPTLLRLATPTDAELADLARFGTIDGGGQISAAAARAYAGLCRALVQLTMALGPRPNVTFATPPKALQQVLDLGQRQRLLAAAELPHGALATPWSLAAPSLDQSYGLLRERARHLMGGKVVLRLQQAVGPRPQVVLWLGGRGLRGQANCRVLPPRIDGGPAQLELVTLHGLDDEDALRPVVLALLSLGAVAEDDRPVAELLGRPFALTVLATQQRLVLGGVTAGGPWRRREDPPAAGPRDFLALRQHLGAELYARLEDTGARLCRRLGCVALTIDVAVTRRFDQFIVLDVDPFAEMPMDLRDATGWSGANHLARALLQAARPAAPSDQAAQGIY